MGIDNNVSVTGNVTRDPELRFTQGGMAVASFGLAWNKRKQDGEEEVSFFDVTCFRSLAENVAESITKGTRVVVAGTLSQRRAPSRSGRSAGAGSWVGVVSAAAGASAVHQHDDAHVRAGGGGCWRRERW